MRSISPKWLMVVLLFVGLALDYLNRLALFSVIPLWRVDLQASDATVGLVVSLFLWTYGLLSPLAGFLGDRFSRRGILIASVGSWGLVTAASGFVTTGWQLVGMRTLLAVAQVSFMPLAQALVAEFHDRETRARASGYYQAGSYVGIFLAGLPSAWLTTRWGWRAMMMLSGATGLVFALVLLKYMPRPPAGDSVRKPVQNRTSLRAVVQFVRVPSVLALMFAFSLSSIAQWIVFSYLPLFVYERYHLSLEAAAFDATFYIQAAAFILMPFYTTFSDRRTASDPRNRYLVAALASVLGLPSLIAIGSAHHTAILIAGLICFGLVMISSDSTWLAMLCNVVAKNEWATGYGLLNFSGTMSGGLAAFFAALLMHRLGFGAIMASLGALYVLIAVLLMFCGYVLLNRDKQNSVEFPPETSPLQGKVC